jgi:hypothetical protein
MRDTRRTVGSARFSRGDGLSPHHDRDTRSRATITPSSRTKSERALKTVKQKIEKDRKNETYSFREERGSRSTRKTRILASASARFA